MAYRDDWDPDAKFYVDRFVYAFRHHGPTASDPHVGRRAHAVRLLLHELAVFADWNRGSAFPSRETLAARMGGVTLETVTLAIQAAKATGWLEVHEAPASKRSGRGWHFNTYRLVIPPDVETRIEQDGKSAQQGAARIHDEHPDTRHAGRKIRPAPQRAGRRSPTTRADSPVSRAEKPPEEGGISATNLGVDLWGGPSINPAATHANGNGGTSTAADEGGHREVIGAIRSRPAGLTRDQALRYATLGTDEERDAFLISIGYRE